MEPTDEQLEKMEAMGAQYRQDMKAVEELEAEMFVNGKIEAPKIIDPNGPEELLDTPETTTEIFFGDPITCPVEDPEQPLSEPGTFLHWLACQGHRNDPIGDLAMDYINDITYNDVKYMSYSGFYKRMESCGAYDGVIEALESAKTEFDDFQEEEAVYRDEQFMLKNMKEKHVGC